MQSLEFYLSHEKKEIPQKERRIYEKPRTFAKLFSYIAQIEEEDKLDNLILKHCAVMRKLRILWTHNILGKSMFYTLYGGVESEITG